MCPCQVLPSPWNQSYYVKFMRGHSLLVEINKLSLDFKHASMRLVISPGIVSLIPDYLPVFSQQWNDVHLYKGVSKKFLAFLHIAILHFS